MADKLVYGLLSPACYASLVGEANFGDDDASAIKACVARINGKEINASAMRNLTLLNSSGEMQKLPLTGDKDVVVYLRHLG